jgi:hypothetical protein
MVRMSVRVRLIAPRLLIFSHVMVPCRWHFRYLGILGHCILGGEKLRETTARVVDVVSLVLLWCFMSVVT